MRAAFRQLDELLRGVKTDPGRLIAGETNLRLRIFVPLAVALGAAYGFFMGWFAVLGHTPPNYQQLLASTLKIPALFLLTLLITFPSLYVFNALLGCRLRFHATLQLLLGAIVVNLAVAASFGAILGFFTLSTTSYSFMVLLNVALLGIAGAVGLGFLLRVLRRVAFWQAEEDAAAARIPAIDTNTGELRPLTTARASDPLGPANYIFRVWILIYALVGAQMGWILRPFIGAPHVPFTWFRPRSGNFFQAVIGAVESLLKS